MSPLYLYSSVGCHLCDKAEALLETELGDLWEDVMLIEIADSDDMVASYGLRIPVFAGTSVSGEWMELDWPFGAIEIHAFVAALQEYT